LDNTHDIAAVDIIEIRIAFWVLSIGVFDFVFLTLMTFSIFSW
jgi:hypothetical protein